MNRKARRWAAAAAFILLVAGGVLAYGQVSGTFAVFSADTGNMNGTFQGSWIPAPSGTSSALPTAANYSTITLNWTSGASAAAPSPTPVTAQELSYADGGTGATASCPAITSYTDFKAETSAATTDAVTGTDLTHWWCFAAYSKSATSWTSQPTTFTARQILVPLSATMTDTAGSTRFNTNDFVTIVYNQAVNIPTANRLCAVNNGSADFILLGDTRTSGTCAAADTYTIGKISGITVSSSSSSMTTSVTRSTTNVPNDTLTVKITAGTTTTMTTQTGLFTGQTGVTAVTGTLPTCISTAAPNCTASAGGHF